MVNNFLGKRNQKLRVTGVGSYNFPSTGIVYIKAILKEMKPAD